MGYDTRKNGNQELFFFLGFFVILTVVIGLVVAVTYKPAPSIPTSPTVSTVSLPEGVSEFCDGNNMVYLTAQALAVAPNDERCNK